MPTLPTHPRTLAVVGVMAALALTTSCAPTGRGATRTPPPITTRSPSLRGTTEGRDDAREGTGRAAVALTDEHRSGLGLPAHGEQLEVAALAPLTAAQWDDPGAVAARLALLQTNYRAGEDPRHVSARWVPYLASRLVEDLAASGSTAPPPDELHTPDAVFVGEVLSLAIVELSSAHAVVNLILRRGTVVGGKDIQRPRIVFWVVTLVRDPAAERWFVAELDRS